MSFGNDGCFWAPGNAVEVGALELFPSLVFAQHVVRLCPDEGVARCVLLDSMKQIGDGNSLRELLNAATPFLISAGLSLQFFGCFYFFKHWPEAGLPLGRCEPTAAHSRQHGWWLC